MLADKWFHFLFFLIRYAEHHETPRRKALVKRIQVRHLFAAWRAPCCPEVHQHNLAAKIREHPLFAGNIRQAKFGMLAVGVIGLEGRYGGTVLAVSDMDGRLDELLADEAGQLDLRIRRASCGG